MATLACIILRYGLVLGTIFSSLYSFAAPANLSYFQSIGDRIHQLNGQISYMDGANCFNAALVGIGYVDQKFYTDPAEYEVMLNKFCRMRAPGESPKAGDLVLFRLIVAPVHGALIVNSESSEKTVFEKLSAGGKSSQFILGLKPAEYSYVIKRASESSFFNGTSPGLTCHQCPPAETEYYECQAASTVRPRLANLFANPEGQAMLNLASWLDELGSINQPFVTQEQIDKTNTLILELANALPISPEASAISAALLVRGHSLIGGLRMLEPYSAEFKLKMLNDKLKALLNVLKADAHAHKGRFLSTDFFYHQQFIY